MNFSIPNYLKNIKTIKLLLNHQKVSFNIITYIYQFIKNNYSYFQNQFSIKTNNIQINQ